MKKFISLFIFVVAFTLVSVVHANGDGMLRPSVPVYSQQPHSEFNMHGHINGWTNGRANADGSGSGPGTHETYSTGESDSFLNMESVQTEFGSGTNCGANCADNFARIESGFIGSHQSGAFSSNSGAEGSSSIAHTGSGVGFNGHTAIGTGDYHHHGDWGHHGQD